MVIQSVSLRNFRNFPEKEISFHAGKNIIVGKNGHGKSNILEALCLPVTPLVETHPEYLLERGKEVFFIRYHLESWDLSFSYEKISKRRKYLLWEKSTTKNKLKEYYPNVVSFHPIMMNMMYLWPSERRNFLDGILAQSYQEYSALLWTYKKIVTSRNKVLKNIFEKKSEVWELDFWNQKFIETWSKIYWYRKSIVEYLSICSPELKKYFFWKVKDITFHYDSKTDISHSEESLRSYITNNREKEILSRKTLRWPHLDDFNILIDNIPLIHYASRWEVKSIILGLKFLESQYIQKHSQKDDIIFVIDDLLSELDEEHRNLLWKHIWERQSIITSIEDFEVEGNRIFI